MRCADRWSVVAIVISTAPINYSARAVGRRGRRRVVAYGNQPPKMEESVRTSPYHVTLAVSCQFVDVVSELLQLVGVEPMQGFPAMRKRTQSCKHLFWFSQTFCCSDLCVARSERYIAAILVSRVISFIYDCYFTVLYEHIIKLLFNTVVSHTFMYIQ